MSSAYWASECHHLTKLHLSIKLREGKICKFWMEGRRPDVIEQCNKDGHDAPAFNELNAAK